MAKGLAALPRKGPQVDDLKKADVRTTGFASDNVFNALTEHMMRLGYHEINEVVSDVYEGMITNEASRLVDDPAHDDLQEDGFGHYGWESK